MITTRAAWLIFLTYFPLGVIGLWRWTVWLIKKMYGAGYQPATGQHSASVAVITPVYNEDPKVFAQALASWHHNGVDEIVAVIDYTDKACLTLFRKFQKTFPGAKLIVTKKPGKRPALVDGIQVAQSDIVALVDSDTIWSETVKENALIPFQDPKVGGVSTRQNVLQPTTLAQRLFNAQLNLRYLEELPFMVGRGGVVITCISGRTGFYRRAAVLPLLPALLHETFWGKPVISGDDKRLTYLVEGAGWKVAFQQNAQVFTPGMPTLPIYFKQRLRWTRNSWRADLRTLTQPWVYRHPRFVWYLTDRILQPFAQLLSPIAFIVSLALGLWLPALVLFIWWHIGRIIRLWPHLKNRWQDLKLIPVFVTLNFYNSLMKIYALATLNRQGWITRWSKERLPGPPPWLRLAGGYSVTAVLIAALATGMAAHEMNAQGSIQKTRITNQFRPTAEAPDAILAEAGLSEPPFQRYVMQAGDTVQRVAEQFNLAPETLLRYNAAILPSLDHIEVGLVLTIPTPNAPALPPATFKSEYEQLGPLRATYLPDTNTLEVRGRGQQISLRRLQALAGPETIEEIGPKQWHLKRSLSLKAGVSLRVTREEVEWLKLESNGGGFVALIAEDGQIILDGVKVTSWDSAAQQVDTNSHDGRSFIAAKGLTRLDISDSELAYLGFQSKQQTATGGVSWFVADAERASDIAAGEIKNSRFHHNYQGAYVSGTRGLIFENSSFFANEVYGIDIFGGSRDIVIANNRVHHNGQHGIVLAQDADHTFIRHNFVLANGRHGIILHEGSDQNVIEWNRVESHDDGIVVQRSNENVIHANTLAHHRRGLRITNARNTQTTANQITMSSQADIYIDTDPEELTYGDAPTESIYVDIL